jgi:hypothetical protein
VVVCGIAAAADGELANASQAVPAIALALIVPSIVCAFLKRRLRPKLVVVSDRLLADQPKRSRGFIASERLWLACFLILMLGGPASATAEIWRLVNRWPANPDTDAVVVSTGQDVKIHLPQTLRSVKGYWSASGRADLLDAPPQVTASLAMSTRTQSWSGTIYFDKNQSQTENADLWVICRIPDAAELRGRTVRIRVQLEALYPHLQPAGHYDDVRARVISDVEVNVAQDRDAAAQYRQLVWIGYIIGLVLAGSTSVLLSFFDLRANHGIGR